MSEAWKPFPKQAHALSISADTAFEILFGGARGPGKTDAGIQWLHGEKIGKLPNGKDKYYIHNLRYRALVLRRDYDDLSDWIDRASYLFKYAGAEIVGKPAEVRWPSGAKFRLGHLKDRASYEKYLGHEYQRLLIEELTLIPQEKYYTQILGSVRTTIPEIKTQVFITTNPGSVGHHWVYNRFIKPAKYNTVFTGPDGRKRIYIPGTIEDNPVLMKDKGYLLYLEGLKLTDPNLYKAWRHGDWSVFEGQFFGEFDSYIHVNDDFPSHANLSFVGGADWGYSPRPFVLLLGALEKVPWQGSYFHRLWLYDEIRYTKKTPQELSDIIKKREEIIQSFDILKLDPSAKIPAKDGALSIMDQFVGENIPFTPASNNRVSGWIAVRKWLSMAPDNKPYMFMSPRCNFLIKNLPMVIYDETKKDDINTTGPDDECFCPHTQILTNRGYISIINVNAGDYTWTPLGWSKILAQKNTGKKHLLSFRTTKATGNHRFLTQDGFLRLKDLQKTDKLWNVFISKELPIGATRILQDWNIGGIFPVVQRRMEALYFISVFGNIFMEKLPKWVKIPLIFITKMTIMITTILKILNWLIVPNILNGINKHFFKQVEKILKLQGNTQLSGINHAKQKNSINGWENIAGKIKKYSFLSAINVEKNIMPILSGQSFVASTVKCQCLDYGETYNLKTDTGMFTANNAIVSNCDALRYLCIHLKWIDAQADTADRQDVTILERTEVNEEKDIFGEEDV